MGYYPRSAASSDIRTNAFGCMTLTLKLYREPPLQYAADAIYVHSYFLLQALATGLQRLEQHHKCSIIASHAGAEQTVSEV